MNTLKKVKLASLPVYPFLFGLYPVLYLWNANRAQQPAYVVVHSLIVTFMCLLALYGIVLAITRNIHRAALFTTAASLFVLSYGHLSNLFTQPENDVENPALLPISVLVVLATLVFITVKRYGNPGLTKTLNLVSTGLVVIQLFTAAPYYLAMSKFQAKPVQASVPEGHVTITGKPRDVYFILLDNYGREDVLYTKSGLDNSELVNALKERGFVFPDCAQSNYFATAPVITSILNMNYLNQLGISEASYIKRGRYSDMTPLIQDSEVLRRFRSYGYHTVTFRGYMGMIDIQNVDTYVSFEKDTEFSRRIETTNFEELYLGTTLLGILNEQYKVYPDLVEKYGPSFLAKSITDLEIPDTKYYKEYLQNHYAFDALEKIPTEIQEPKFVYAHIYSAHWPFLVEPDGSLRKPISEKMTTEGYVAAVKFTNNRIVDAIDAILENSEPDPIIILQGDHSNGWTGNVEWSGMDRVKILSAYYLPDGGEKLLYEDITPVNNFRLIFKLYFGEDIDLLPDQSYYLDPTTRKSAAAPRTCISETVK
jgi:hypothetical protein